MQGARTLKSQDLSQFIATNRLSAIHVSSSVALYLLLFLLACVCMADARPHTAVLLAGLAGVSTVRVFILQHDCSHYALFSSRRVNVAIGQMLGVLTLVPFRYWRRFHLLHHGSSGNIDNRGLGDIFTYTTREYSQLPAHKKLLYRLYRNPLVLLSAGGCYYFLLKMRNPALGANRLEALEILIIDAFWVFVYALAHFGGIGVWNLALLQLAAVAVGGGIGMLLFYLQHQFEDAYWRRQDKWDATAAALKGSTLLELPRVVERFLGHINFHHVHHLNPKIVSYRIKEAHDFLEAQGIEAPRVHFRDIGKCFSFKLIDEQTQRLVGFGGRS